jgi:hypothetical protein
MKKALGILEWTPRAFLLCGFSPSDTSVLNCDPTIL